jgi:hypothetical protein
MSHTIRVYNKLNYFRRLQQQYEFRWIFVPQYHPYRQSSWSISIAFDYGYNKKGLSKRRRIWYKNQMKLDINNL